jgi:hypothetical protein
MEEMGWGWDFDKVWMWRRFGCADGTGVLAFMKIKKKGEGICCLLGSRDFRSVIFLQFHLWPHKVSRGLDGGKD